MGQVFWITGLSGAGKTTIAGALKRLFEENNHKVMLLDGDILREVFGERNAYTREERMGLAMKYARLCRMLSDQGFTVICSTISLFKEVHQWNRKNILNYKEIYLKVSLDVLETRDSKAIYSQASNGSLKQVMGVDIPYDEPESPNLTINNDGSVEPREIAKHIYEFNY